MATAGSSHLPYDPAAIQDDTCPLEDIYLTSPDTGEFRYLVLDGYDERGLLQCLLLPASLSDAIAIQYTAISYACDETEPIWYGDYDYSNPKPVSINGAMIMIPNKVANILCMMQEHGRSLLWMDSLCINQKDNREKSSQVAQMGYIYSLASDVISVIGRPTRETDIALQARFLRSKDLYCSSYDELFIGLDLLLSERIYWRRTWVLQEIALARDTFLCCGSYMIDYGHVKDLLDMLRGERFALLDVPRASGLGKHLFSWMGQRMYQSGLTRNYVHPPSRFADTLSVGRVVKNAFLEASHARPFEVGTEKDIQGRPFLEVLRLSRQFNQCQDLRDLLYSRLALASDALDLVDKPDYTIPVEQLFRSFATKSIENTCSLEIITYATHSSMALPTWAPDWSKQVHDWQPSRDESYDRSATSSIPWNPSLQPRVSSGDANELHAPGRILMTVFRETSSTRRTVDKAYQSMLSITTDGEHDAFERPRPGDLVCLLQGCSLLVYLRPMENHFVIVGRNDRWQNRIFSDYLESQLWIYKTKNRVGEGEWKWKFKDPDWVSGLEQKVFRIR